MSENKETGMKQVRDPEDEILFRQRRMGPAAFVGFLIFVCTVQWMSLDVYLPAMPQIRGEFGVSEAQLNLTLSIYVVCNAVGMILSGPLSDKYGRKKLILTGLVLFCTFNVLSAFSTTLPSLIAFRSVVGIASGAVYTVALAMVKDSLAGRRFQQAMTFLQSLAILGPIVAPLIGAFLINHFSWHWVFLSLTILAVLSMIPVALMEETLIPEKRVQGNIWKATGELFLVLKNGQFTQFLLIVGLLGMSWYSYMAVCSYIYIEDFGVSNYQYGLYYGAGAIVSFFAPFVYLALSRIMRSRRIMELCFLMMVASGLSIALIGARSVWGFFAMTVLFLLAEGVSRPLGMVILLDQREDAIGAASSVSNFTVSILGVAGTSAATLGWSSHFVGLGSLLILGVLVSVIIWIPLLREKKQLRGL